MSTYDIRDGITYWSTGTQNNSSYTTNLLNVSISPNYYGSALGMFSSSSYMPMTSTYVSSAFYPGWGTYQQPKPEDSPFITVRGREYKVEFDPNGDPMVYRQGRLRDIGRKLLDERWFRVKKEEKDRVLAEFTLRKMAAGEKQETAA